MTDTQDDAPFVSAPTTRTMAMPCDTNPAGDIFGGWVLAQMDIAGGICAAQRCQSRVVTAAIDAMHFIRPVKVGDVLGVYTRVSRVGKSSLDIFIEAWVRRERIGSREKVTNATFTFVAVDRDGRPIPIPPRQEIPDYARDRFGDL